MISAAIRRVGMTRDDLYSLYSDYFKSVHGFRPRWAADWSIERLESAIEALDEYVGDEPPMPTSGDGWAFVPAA